MTVSNKKVISVIKTLPPVFTRKSLQEIILKKDEKPQPVKKGRAKKKAPYKPHKDISKIEETLTALISIGFLVKEKKGFKKTGSLEFENEIKINTSGDAISRFNDDDIIIKKNDTGFASNNDRVHIKIFDFKKNFFYGKVTGITKKDKLVYAAKIQRKTGAFATLSLLDAQIDMEAICSNTGKNIKPGDFAIIELTGKLISGQRECKIIETYSDDNEEFDFLRIKIKHSLPDSYSSDYNKINPESLIPEKELYNRKDYTKLFTITIDGETARDYDDALSIKVNKKTTKLYVHIADVSAYIQQGSDMDKEAFERGNSYYLGNRVIPMLPEIISNEICSLQEGVKRHTLTAEMLFDSNGNMTKFEAFRGIIKVNKRLTYEGADKILKKKGADPLSTNLKNMMKLAKILNKKRNNSGRLDLNLADQEIVYDKDNVKEIRFAQRLKSHMLIEECMLSANEAVSRELKEKSVPTLYRVHEKISDENMESLKDFMKVLGIKISEKNAGINLQEVLQKVAGKPYEQVVNLVILKSMMQAFYGPEPLGHFGLGFPDYTHFTAPIRRYPDLVVHRCLKSFIDSSAPPYNMHQLLEAGEKSSTMERVAQKAERDLIKI
ncbi:MAG: RNB domain-containing ribonuclease, partial [Spirochaetota bacterium]